MREDVPTADGESSNAISLFAQTANANDFPVLKAFQEYIDAEQSKARKRMLGLSIFFCSLACFSCHHIYCYHYIDLYP